MKTNVLSLLALSILTFAACKKDQLSPLKAFEDITYSDIQKAEANFSDQQITVSTVADGAVKAGSILFYKTNNDVLGKFKIISISPQNLLTIDFVNYKADGILGIFGVTIEDSYTFDFDTGVQTNDPLISDIHWSSGTNKFFAPENTAEFYVYSK